MTAEEDRFKREARQWFILTGEHIVSDPLFETLEEGTQRELINIVSDQEHPVRLERAAAEQKQWERVAERIRVDRERRAQDLAPLVAKQQEKDARIVRLIVIVWVVAAITTLVLWLFRFTG